MRIDVRSIKAIIWAGCAASGLAILALLAHVFFDVVPTLKNGKLRHQDLASRIQRALAVPSTIQARVRAPSMNGSEYLALSELNVTGKEPPSPEPAALLAKSEAIPFQPAHEVLQVRSTIATTRAPEQGFATIRYLSDPPQPLTPPPQPDDRRHVPSISGGYLRVGDRLRAPYDQPPFSARVLAISAQGVEFEWGGRTVLLSVPTLAEPMDSPRTLPALETAAVEPAPRDFDASAEESERLAPPDPPRE